MTRPGTIRDMGWLLNNFADQVAGIAHVVAVSADGLLLAASRALPEERAEQLAAISAGVPDSNSFPSTSSTARSQMPSVSRTA